MTLFRKFWGLCEDHLMTFWGTFEDHRILRTLITFWGLWNRLEYLLWTSEDFEGFEDLLRNLRTFCGSVENLRPERTLGNLGAFSWLFEDFVDRFRTSWRPEDLMLAEHWRTFQDLLMTSCGLFEFFLSETFEDFVRTIWWPFEEPLTTTEFEAVDKFLRTWGRLEYLWLTSEDFEGFEGLLRNLRTFWGSVEKLRSEDLGYLLCSFLTFSRLCGPFEDFLKTWGPDALRTLKNHSGTFDDFLWTYWGPLRNFEESEDFENILSNLRIIWGPEGCGRRGPFVHILDILRTFWTFYGLFEDLRSWGSQNIEELLRTSWWLLVDLLSSFYRKLFRTLLGPFDDLSKNFWGRQDFEHVDNFLRTLKSSWIPFVDLWGLRGLWGPFEEYEDILRITWETEAWGPRVPFVHFLDFFRTLWTF